MTRSPRAEAPTTRLPSRGRLAATVAAAGLAATAALTAAPASAATQRHHLPLAASHPGAYLQSGSSGAAPGLAPQAASGGSTALAPQTATTASPTLAAGQTLASGQSVASPNGQFQLTMRLSGDMMETSGGVPIWASNTGVAGSRAVMQGDGNFVIYTPANRPVWYTGTQDHAGAWLSLGSTAGLAVTDGSATLWANRASDALLRPGQPLEPGWMLVSANGLYQLEMQYDGALTELLTTPQHQVPLWSSHTTVSGDHAVMEPDGDVAVVSPANEVLWQTGTTTYTGADLVVGNDADAVVAAPTGVTAWSNLAANLRTGIVSAAASKLGWQDLPSGTFCNRFTTDWGAGSTSGCSVNDLQGEAWCADFAAWAWKQAGVNFTYGWGSGDVSAAAASFYSFGVAHHTWHWASSGYVPAPGDVAVFGLDSSGTYADHAAVVVTVGRPGADVINGDWWSSGNGAVVAQWDETTATGSDTISGYASP
jgi:hypothetical protein